MRAISCADPGIRDTDGHLPAVAGESHDNRCVFLAEKLAEHAGKLLGLDVADQNVRAPFEKNVSQVGMADLPNQLDIGLEMSDLGEDVARHRGLHFADHHANAVHGSFTNMQRAFCESFPAKDIHHPVQFGSRARGADDRILDWFGRCGWDWFVRCRLD